MQHRLYSKLPVIRFGCLNASMTRIRILHSKHIRVCDIINAACMGLCWCNIGLMLSILFSDSFVLMLRWYAFKYCTHSISEYLALSLQHAMDCVDATSSSFKPFHYPILLVECIDDTHSDTAFVTYQSTWHCQCCMHACTALHCIHGTLLMQHRLHSKLSTVRFACLNASMRRIRILHS